MSSQDNAPEQTSAAEPQLFPMLPFRLRDREIPGQFAKAHTPASASPKLREPRIKQSPRSLVLGRESTHVRSPTESSMSTLSSAPDSATTCSMSVLGSPSSLGYASDFHDYQDIIAGSRPASRVLHRHKPSDGTCSTFVNDDEDDPYFGAMLYCSGKVPVAPVEATPERNTVHQSRPDSPSAILVSPSVQDASEAHLTFYEESLPSRSPEPASTPLAEKAEKWESESTASVECSADDADTILDYTLQMAYGVDLEASSLDVPRARQIARNFVRQLGQTMYQSGLNGPDQNGMDFSNSNSSTPGNSGGSHRDGKRKKQPGGGKRDDGTDDLSEGEGYGLLPVKKPKPNPPEEEPLRLSCPFRKRNPNRFNVRDHHSCAMTYFPKFAELRQHIVKQHKRDEQSAFVCDRCNRDFAARKELRDHQRLPREQICEISDHDPESGIDGPTSVKLLSRKRASGTSPEIQWREVWNILFPDDDDSRVPTYQFTPVIEHVEISDAYQNAFSHLLQSLSGMFANPATLDTLATKFHQCFLETVQRCETEAQSMPYANRSNKRGEQLATAASTGMQLRKPTDIASKRDSGVSMNDEGSDESGSVLDLSYKNSVRTVQSSVRNSHPPSASNRELAPARPPSAIYDPMPFPIPLSASATPLPGAPSLLGATDMQAWTQDVMMPFPQATHGFGIGPADMHVPHGMSDTSWQHSFYDPSEDTDGMRNDLSGFM
ncbi:uncharacterized protein F5Z01DRAFT_649228 [Emericellopsis atlantica]|uniref:C2H2-type domain-containing protein n=1 Tax=Emericellopsis atlantica TaxID=2614577 RepID=A0A9P7ZRG0_9HYPO|nr:uncharacterized protein F5Z01DRAFT_649228 [Emericellopsis atlantica]KAG9256855.1 hypothetical protein F5Z01DRAFT_649228 [Emericellopsis atlantica]